MIKLSNTYLINIFTRLLILLSIAKVISLAIWWFLPSESVELKKENNRQQKYRKIDFHNMLNKPLTKSSPAIKRAFNKNNISITNMILKGLYGIGVEGYAIVSLKSSEKKTSIVAVGDNYSGYTLKSILSHSVVFTKMGKDYNLKMLSSKLNASKAIKYVTDDLSDNKVKKISRQDIKLYAKNPQQILKDITIVAIKNGKKIKGFKVTKINKESSMAKIGLKKNDVIIKANNTVLKSYKDALTIYKNLDALSNINIVILRNNIEQELIYEIN